MAGHQIPPLGAPHGETDAVGSRLTQRMAAAMTLHDMDEDIQRLQRRQLARDPATANLHKQIAIDAYYQDLAASHCTCPPRVEFQPTARPFLSVHHEFSNVTPKVNGDFQILLHKILHPIGYTQGHINHSVFEGHKFQGRIEVLIQFWIRHF